MDIRTVNETGSCVFSTLRLFDFFFFCVVSLPVCVCVYVLACVCSLRSRPLTSKRWRQSSAQFACALYSFVFQSNAFENLFCCFSCISGCLKHESRKNKKTKEKQRRKKHAQKPSAVELKLRSKSAQRNLPFCALVLIHSVVLLSLSVSFILSLNSKFRRS